MTRISEKSSLPLVVLLTFSACAVGSVFIPISAVLSAALAVMLCVTMFKNGSLYVSKSIETLFITAFCLGYLVTALWGADKYNCVAGFVKFLPMLLFGIYASQFDRETKDKALGVIPVIGTVMTAASFVLTQIKATAPYFSVAGRIAGFFQYPNTFALFLIVGIVVLSGREKLKITDIMLALVLVAGIFLSGSRSSFIVLVFAVILILFTSKNKAFRLTVIGLIAVGVVAAVILFAVTGRYGAFARFLTISKTAGTFLGRLLYYKDALRVIAKHPFGIGYLGYYFMQGSFQTGVYSNEFVHNELLQFLLDIGWIPTALGIAAFVRSLLSKSVSAVSKIIIVTVLAHSMLDFDFQFLIIGFIVLLCLDFDSKREEISFGKASACVTATILGLCIVLSAYIGVGEALYLMSKGDKAAALCRYNTMAQLEQLEQTDEPNAKNAIADCIIKNDKFIGNAYSAKAYYYYSSGDIEKAIDYKKKAVERSRYYTDEYVDYAVMLINAGSQYTELGDYDSAAYCADKLLELDETVKSVNDGTDKLAYKLQDKPSLEFPDEINEIIDGIKAQN